MEKVVATISKFADAEEFTTLSKTVEDIDSHVRHLNHSLVTFTSDHYAFHQAEKEKYDEELSQIRLNIHRLRTALIWTLFGLLCSGAAIFALCIHLIS